MPKFLTFVESFKFLQEFFAEVSHSRTEVEDCLPISKAIQIQNVFSEKEPRINEMKPLLYMVYTFTTPFDIGPSAAALYY